MGHIARVREIRIVHTLLAGRCHLRGVSVGSESKGIQGNALNSSNLVWGIVTFL